MVNCLNDIAIWSLCIFIAVAYYFIYRAWLFRGLYSGVFIISESLIYQGWETQGMDIDEEEEDADAEMNEEEEEEAGEEVLHS